MKRIVLTDDSGKWFNEKTAIVFTENTWWNGNNHISCATGSQWNHEQLFYTKSGRWILNWWSQYQNSKETYEEISENAAIEWLISQEHFNDLEKLPEKLQKRIQQGIAGAEV